VKGVEGIDAIVFGDGERETRRDGEVDLSGNGFRVNFMPSYHYLQGYVVSHSLKY
jgi:hypothetical protein